MQSLFYAIAHTVSGRLLCCRLRANGLRFFCCGRVLVVEAVAVKRSHSEPHNITVDWSNSSGQIAISISSRISPAVICTVTSRNPFPPAAGTRTTPTYRYQEFEFRIPYCTPAPPHPYIQHQPSSQFKPHVQPRKSRPFRSTQTRSTHDILRHKKKKNHTTKTSGGAQRIMITTTPFQANQKK